MTPETNWKQLKIKVSDLALWDENPRFPDTYSNENEKNLISYYLQKNHIKIKELASQIVKDSDLPQLEKIVVLEKNNKYIVFEGNRRVVAYKLLINPYLAGQENQAFFMGLSKDFSPDDDFSIETLINDKEKEVERFIERKHYYGNNEVPWNEPERRKFNTRRASTTNRDRIRSDIANKVKELNLDENHEINEAVLGKGYVTTLYRILDSDEAREKLGYSVNENGEMIINDDSMFNDLLKVVVFNVWSKQDFQGDEINSRSLNTKEHIKNYLNKISSNDAETVKQEINKHKKQNLFGEQSVQPQNQTKSDKRSSKYLFYATDIPYKLDNRPLQSLYDELRRIEYQEYPNATHDLIRSFLECSLQTYLKHPEIDLFKQLLSEKNRKSYNVTLNDMLNFLYESTNSPITDDSVKLIPKHLTSDDRMFYSVERMNMVNHNANWSSNSKDVKDTWDKIEPLLKEILNPK